MDHHCLFCGSKLDHIFADLGSCPPSNAFLRPDQLDGPELFHPLQAWVCSECLLVQSPHYKRPQEIFTHDYAYYSSYSKSWVEHAKKYVEDVAKRFNLGKDSLILEVGSNDGYLLQHAKARNIPCLGIDPCAGAAAVAEIKGIPTITEFFNVDLAQKLITQGIHADLLCGINVFAHVPNINDFAAAIQLVLKPEGVVTMEFPHLLHLVRETQFDTIYHEHYFYYSLGVVIKILEAHGLRVFDVDELETHGGSLRIYACNKTASHLQTDSVNRLIRSEQDCGMNDLEYYLNFQNKIEDIRYDLLNFFINLRKSGKTIGAYGAAAKGNTLLNYSGIRPTMLPYVVDASPHKQGLFMPGSRIPIVTETKIMQTKPDYILILPWNLREEIATQLSYIREWGAKFVTAIPKIKIW